MQCCKDFQPCNGDNKSSISSTAQLQREFPGLFATQKQEQPDKIIDLTKDNSILNKTLNIKEDEKYNYNTLLSLGLIQEEALAKEEKLTKTPIQNEKEEGLNNKTILVEDKSSSEDGCSLRLKLKEERDQTKKSNEDRMMKIPLTFLKNKRKSNITEKKEILDEEIIRLKNDLAITPECKTKTFFDKSKIKEKDNQKSGSCNPQSNPDELLKTNSVSNVNKNLIKNFQNEKEYNKLNNSLNFEEMEIKIVKELCMTFKNEMTKEDFSKGIKSTIRSLTKFLNQEASFEDMSTFLLTEKTKNGNVTKIGFAFAFLMYQYIFKEGKNNSENYSIKLIPNQWSIEFYKEKLKPTIESTDFLSKR